MNRPDIAAIRARVERASGTLCPMDESGPVGQFGLYELRPGGRKLAEFALPGDMLMFRAAPTDIRALLEYVGELEERHESIEQEAIERGEMTP